MSHPCPVCKRSGSGTSSGSACAACGRKPAGGSEPSQSASWDDDELGGGLEFSRGGAETHASGGASAYSGGGVSLGDDDDPFADDVPGGALELDLPSSHSAHSARSIPAAPPEHGPAPLSSGRIALPATSQPPRGSATGASLRPNGPPSASARAAEPASLPPRSAPGEPGKRDPAFQIARYPDAPAKPWQAPGYAIKVLLRQLELRQDLESLRKRRSPDVALYERALGLYDRKAFAIGLAIDLAALAVVTVLFFLPVILRFAHAPE